MLDCSCTLIHILPPALVREEKLLPLGRGFVVDSVLPAIQFVGSLVIVDSEGCILKALVNLLREEFVYKVVFAFLVDV